MVSTKEGTCFRKGVNIKVLVCRVFLVLVFLTILIIFCVELTIISDLVARLYIVFFFIFNVGIIVVVLIVKINGSLYFIFL